MVDTTSETNLGQLLLRAFRWFDESLIAHLRSAGWPYLTRAHSLVFANLDEAGTRAAELARRAGVSRQAIHKVVHELIDLGLVELRDDPANRSAKLVVATAEGRRNTTAALATFAELEAELAGRIGRTHVAQLRHALEKDWGPPAAVSAASLMPTHGPPPPTSTVLPANSAVLRYR